MDETEHVVAGDKVRINQRIWCMRRGCGEARTVEAKDIETALGILADSGEMWGAWHHYPPGHPSPVYTAFYCPRHA